MVSSGDTFALERRDQIVGSAQSSELLVADRAGEPVRAALLDHRESRARGVIETVAGIAVVGVYPIIAYRGRVGRAPEVPVPVFPGRTALSAP